MTRIVKVITTTIRTVKAIRIPTTTTSTKIRTTLRPHQKHLATVIPNLQVTATATVTVTPNLILSHKRKPKNKSRKSRMMTLIKHLMSLSRTLLQDTIKMSRTRLSTPRGRLSLMTTLTKSRHLTIKLVRIPSSSLESTSYQIGVQKKFQQFLPISPLLIDQPKVMQLSLPIQRDSSQL